MNTKELIEEAVFVAEEKGVMRLAIAIGEAIQQDKDLKDLDILQKIVKDAEEAVRKQK